MAKHCILLALLLASGQALAQHQVDADGFSNPLQHLRFNPGLDQQEFERASNDALQVYDPLESWNRRVYHFNYRFDQWLFLPLVRGYRAVTPDLVESGVHNFFGNLGEVPTLANSLLQLKGERAMNATARFLFNTIIGVAGLWDPATRMGAPRSDPDGGSILRAGRRRPPPAGRARWRVPTIRTARCHRRASCCPRRSAGPAWPSDCCR